MYFLSLILILIFGSHSSNGKTCKHTGNSYDSSAASAIKCNEASAGKRLVIGDFNGDGRSDWFCDDILGFADTFATAEIGGTFFSTTDPGIDFSWCKSSVGKMYAADIDGNGHDELLCVYNDGTRFEFSYYKGHKFSSQSQIYVSFQCDYSSQELHIGDVNGDGTDDFLCVDKSTGAVLIHYNSGHHRGKRHSSYERKYGSHGERKIHQIPFTFCMGASKIFALGDLNGDGVKDLVCNSLTTGEVEFSISKRMHGFKSPVKKDLEFCKSSGITGDYVRFSVHDIDGDRLADLICIDDIAAGTSYRENVILTDRELLFPTASSPQSTTLSTDLDCEVASANTRPFGISQFKYADFNGDKMADLSCGTNNVGLYTEFSVCEP